MLFKPDAIFSNNEVKSQQISNFEENLSKDSDFNSSQLILSGMLSVDNKNTKINHLN